MKRITTNSILRPATAALLTAGLIGGSGALAGTAMAATTPNGGGAMGPAATAPATPKTPSTPKGGATTKGTNHTAGHLACPSIGFTVMHNDRTGGLVLPAGRYRVWSPNLSCKTASADFTTFLNHYQGTIPGWTTKQYGRGYGVFTQTRTGDSFAVQI
jgi:hypothetical protein